MPSLAFEYISKWFLCSDPIRSGRADRSQWPWLLCVQLQRKKQLEKEEEEMKEFQAQRAEEREKEAQEIQQLKVLTATATVARSGCIQLYTRSLTHLL